MEDPTPSRLINCKVIEVEFDEAMRMRGMRASEAVAARPVHRANVRDIPNLVEHDTRSNFEGEDDDHNATTLEDR